MFDSQKYWETRYKNKGNSGDGSYGKDANLKSNYINQIIKKYNIKTINDYGHGDGNQLSLINGFETYYGYDVSETIRNLCISKFKDRKKYTFIDEPSKFIKCDLSMSLDVIYHIVEEDIYYSYLKTLFNIGNYVLIYGVDSDKSNMSHYKARKFTQYVTNTFPNFELIETNNILHKHVAMYLYKSK
jgi:hypothetical protein|tara:strand:- start:873 stop:1430 length:558 start_codon:yes stop_codon:yes gene_type:complete